MKKYTVAIALFLVGVVGLIAFNLIGSTLDSDGVLIEPFWMLPTSFILILSGIVSAVIKFFKVEIANRNLGLFVMTIVGLNTLYGLYINIMSGLDIIDIGITLSMGFVLILPALLFAFTKEFKKNVLWINIVYLIVTTGGLLNVVTASDPLSAGLPMIVVVIPLAIITSIILLVLRKK